MTLKKPGRRISNVEVTHISSFGLWVLTGEKEYLKISLGLKRPLFMKSKMLSFIIMIICIGQN